MNHCPSQRELESMLVDALDEVRQREIYGHVDDCLQCQGRLDVLSDLKNTLLVSADKLTSQNVDATLQDLMRQLCNQPPDDAISIVPTSHSHAHDDTVDFPGSPNSEAPLGRLGTYNIVERIASGATGILFKARDTKLGRTVAVKVLRGELAASESYRARLVREARAAAALNHDHIVTLYQIGSEPNFPPYLVMEYVQGQSLDERLAQTGAMSPRAAATVVCEVARALSAAHEQGLVHRDVKSANILVDDTNGRAKITDFGLARDDQAANRITMDGAVAGTPAYMSPEQITQPQQVDRRSDVYSLGVVLYELLTGTVPFEGKLQATLMKILHNEPRRPCQLNKSIPVDLETICLEAIAKEPHRRYQTAAQLAADLQRFLEHKPVVARPTTSAYRFWRWCERNPKIVALSGTVIVLLAFIVLGTVVSALLLTDAQQQVDQAKRESRRQSRGDSQLVDFALESLLERDFIFSADDLEAGQDAAQFERQLLANNLLGLQKIVQSTAESGTSDLSTILARQRMGEIQLYLDRPSEALSEFQIAVGLLEDHNAASSEDPLMEQTLLEVWWSIATVCFGQKNFATADKTLNQALVLCQQHAAPNADDPSIDYFLATAYGFLGKSNLLQDKIDRAIEYYQKCLNILRDLQKEDPDDEQVIYDQFVIHQQLGDFFRTLDDKSAARDHYKKVTVRGEDFIVCLGEVVAFESDEFVIESKSGDYPPFLLVPYAPMDDASVIETLAVVHARLAILEIDAGNLKRAQRHGRASFDYVNELVAVYPEREQAIRALKEQFKEQSEFRIRLQETAETRRWITRILNTLEDAG